MVGLWQLRLGGEFAAWAGDLDIAVGAIGEGESWRSAARGDFDARWRASLEMLRLLWLGHQGQLYIRFAHEMNGNWYPWAVTRDDLHDFRLAWRRYRALQREIFPSAKLVFCVNRESVGLGLDWRKLFPGRRYVDVLGVDYYNQFPHVATAADWQDSLTERDSWGGPKGLRLHLRFARLKRLPFAVPEWSENASMGDSAAFISGMYRFFERHGGKGPGRVTYEILFNVAKDKERWLLYGHRVRVPLAAREYRKLFSGA
jgi:hypothetical protein